MLTRTAFIVLAANPVFAVSTEAIATNPAAGTSTMSFVPRSSAAGTKYFITFGSSTTQTGFKINGTKPSSSNPLGNPALPGWTTSAGLNWLGFLVTQFNTSLTLSFNFAVGGATTDAALIPVSSNSVLSFVDQVAEFSQSLANKPSWAPWTAENTLVGVWIGNNDVGNSYNDADTESLYRKVSERYFEQLQVLYDAGVRNFVLLTAGPQQKTPLMLEYGPAVTSKLANAVSQYNDLMKTNLASFSVRNPNVTSWLVLTERAYDTALDNPTAYGAPNATCYNNDGISCLWWNNYHPGIQIHQLLGKEVAQTVGTPWFTVHERRR